MGLVAVREQHGIAMLENTHFAGSLPDTSLVYELRRLALDSVDLLGLFDVIASHLQFPEGELGRHALHLYTWLAFGGSNDDFGDLKLLTYRIERTADGYVTTEPGVAERLARSINTRKADWSKTLGDD